MIYSSIKFLIRLKSEGQEFEALVEEKLLDTILEHLHHALIIFVIFDQFGDLSKSHWMIEVSVECEPLFGSGFVARFQEGGVDWGQVLEPTLGRDELFGWFHNLVVTLNNSEWEPSLLDLWINGLSDVVVGIDLFQNGKVDLIFTGNKSLDENDSKVAVEIEIIFKLGWGASSIKLNELVSKFGGLIKSNGSEIQSHWWKTWNSNPSFKINFSNNFGSLRSIVIFSDKLVEGVDENWVCNRLESNTFKIGLQKLLHFVLTENGFNIVKKLETLFIWDS